MTHETTGLARSIHTRLVVRAKELGVDPNLVLTRFAIERFLYRLSRSPYAEQFVLKGALLLLVWLGETLRPTRDADLLGFGDLSEETLAEVTATRMSFAGAVSAIADVERLTESKSESDGNEVAGPVASQVLDSKLRAGDAHVWRVV